MSIDLINIQTTHDSLKLISSILDKAITNGLIESLNQAFILQIHVNNIKLAIDTLDKHQNSQSQSQLQNVVSSSVSKKIKEID